MSEIDIQPGIVKNIRLITDDQGHRSFKADIQSFIDLQTYTNIPIDQPLYRQYIPVVGQLVTLMAIKSSNGTGWFRRILTEMGETTFPAVNEPGELVIEGSGGGFAYFNNQGDVIVKSSSSLNQVRVLALEGVTTIGQAIALEVPGVGRITITPQDQLGNEESIKIEKESLAGKTTILIKDDRIEIQGRNIVLGRSTDPLLGTPTVQGGAVTSLSPVIGDHSIDLLTGRPIPRSGVVTTTIFPITTPTDLPEGPATVMI